MEILMITAQLILSLSILVVLHELGHFIPARLFKIRVEKFYLFFDPYFSIFKIKKGDTEYGIGWLPLGGYVKIAGMIDESMDTDQLAGPPQEWEFRSKPAWQRLIVMLGGVTVNIILGIFIFWMLTLKYGETYIPNDKLPFGIAPGSVGRTIGLQAGDRIVAVNGKPVVRFEEISSSKVLLGNSQLTVLRNGVEEQIQVPGNILNQVADEGIAEFVQPRIALEPIKEVTAGGAAEKAGIKPGDKILAVNGQAVRYIDEYQQQLKLIKSKTVQIGLLRGVDTIQLNPALAADGTVGISLSLTSLPTETKSYGFVQALPIGASKAWGSFADNAKGIGKVLTGQIKANKAFTGPIGIATMFGSTVNWAKFWSLVGLLSMALALMNLLPIPALDGGHAVFLLIEMIKGKPLSDKFMERAQLVGFVILMALMVLVFGNDIFKHFIK
jgi:regulator of sigma E protease